MRKLFLSIILFSTLIFWSVAQKSIPVYLDESKSMEERIEDALSRMTLEEKIASIHAQSKFSTPGCPRLGIPEIWMSDGPHGVRMEILWDSWRHADWTNDSCVAFPALTCLAATFNPELSFEYGNALGEESRYRKKNVILGPGVNIYRTPLNGRNFEYMGEDPYLASKMVVPYIQGVQQNGVAACLKHYALNNQELWRKHVNVEVSDRALREIYLPAFKAGVVEGKVWTIMGAYNQFRGQWATHHDMLTNKILKEEWGFDGVAMTDWGSTHDTDAAVMNGLDIEMGTRTDGLSYSEKMAYDNYFMAKPYLEKVKSGELSDKELNEKVRRVLRLNFRTNMDRNRPYGSFGTKEHRDVARRIAEEGIILMKNDNNFFPISIGKYKKIAVIGNNAVRPQTVGGGSSELKVKIETSPLKGLQEIYGMENIVFSEGYTSGASKWHPNVADVSKSDSLKQKALEIARESDIVLFFGGLNKNMKQDSESHDRESYELPYGQSDLLNEILKINPNTGVIIISGNAVEMPWIDKIPGLIQSWYLGSEAGTATANVISGKVNPSGKLPFSYPKKLEDNGAHYFGELSYPGDSMNVYYKEDIFVGYRWHDTKKIAPLFPFGHGLSYTTFDYGDIKTNQKEYAKDDVVKVFFRLGNIGAIDGAEVVQLYISQAKPKLPRPVKELKAFKKIYLKAGESQLIDIEIPVKDFAYFDDRSQEWIVDSDQFTIHCASSANNIKSSVKIKVK